MKSRVAASFLLFTLASFVAAQVVPQRVHVSPSVMQGLLVTKVQPEYPSNAKHIQGTVVLKAIIDKEGTVSSLQIISGHPMLAPAAIEAVKQWKYKPYLLNRAPVEVETNVTLNFTLADKPETVGVVGDRPGGIPSGEMYGIASNPPPDSVAAGRVRISSNVMQGLLVTKVPPQYPQEAKDQRIQGAVVLRAYIDKEGSVANLELVSGHPLLAPAAIEAVKQWKYRPYLLNGRGVEVETQIQVNFTLAN
jgi:TonB family protein